MSSPDTDSTRICVKRIFDVAVLLNNSEAKQAPIQAIDATLAENFMKKSTAPKMQ